MFQMVTGIVKWAAIPVLLTASVFSSLAGAYEPLVDSLVCMSAIIFIQRAVFLKQYAWGAGMVAVVVAFSPLFPTIKIFLMLSLACVASVVALLATWRKQPVAAL